ncbi:MAG: Hsp70 family protein [Planctomycetota bacterium]
MGRHIGIDLGTTNSVAAIVDGPQPRVLDSRDGRPQIRSVVGLRRRKGKKADGAEVLVGDVAEKNWQLAPEDTIVSIKRLMGRGVADPEVQRIHEWAMYNIVEPSDGTEDSVRVVMGGREYSPIEISAEILRKVKESAEYRLGEDVTHAVITVPAYFSQIQRDATRRAGLRAGLKVMKILDEPTAAAIAFGTEEEDSTEPKYLLVYDLGGGTFDISVLMWAQNVFAPLDLEGDMWLGGDNFDQAIVEHAVGYVQREYGIDPIGNTRFMVALRRAARDAKERLSSARSADLIVAGLLRDEDDDLVDVTMEITADQLEQLTQHLVDRTVALTEKALQSAGIGVEQIHHVLMAGNSTASPIVQQAVEQMFGREKIMRKMHPKYCVAIGAAIVAERWQGWECTAPDPSGSGEVCGGCNPEDATVCQKCGAPIPDEEQERIKVGPPEDEEKPEALVLGGIAAFNYGTQTEGDKFNVFIQKGDPYPTEEPQTLTFYTQTANERMIRIPVYGGENLERASANEKQGEAFAVLPSRLPAGAAVRVKLTLDGDQVFHLEAHLEDGTDLRPWVLKGETDQKAVEAIRRGQEALDLKANMVGPEEAEPIEKARNDAFEKLQKGDFEGGLDAAERFTELVGQSGRGPDDPEGKAEGLINFTQFILSEYNWAIGAERSYKLNNLVEETRQAMQAGDTALLEQKVQELDEATDDLPDIIQLVLAMRGAINDAIRPSDPSEAAALLQELDRIIERLRAQDATAAGELMSFAEKVSRTIDRLKPKCPQCGLHLAGKGTCHRCGWDPTLLTDKSSASSSGGIISA